MQTDKFILLFCSLILLFSACTPQSSITEADLEGVTWVLTAYNDSRPIEGREPIIEFAQGQVSGTTGCNHYGGSYQINGNEIRFSDLFNTEMACLDPTGIMEQEQTYLELLRAAERFELLDGVLTMITNAQQTLVFAVQGENLATAAPTLEQLTPTPVAQAAAPTYTPAFEPPTGFKKYQDADTLVSIYIPESWVGTGIVAGEYAIFQSYPVDKYIGGEAMQAGDTKCGLNIRPEGASADDLLHGWRSHSMTTIVSEQQITLGSGLPGQRFEIASMGIATVFITEIDQRVILLNCFGDFTPVDQIAATLRANK